jgi:hypothetical protein
MVRRGERLKQNFKLTHDPASRMARALQPAALTQN